MLCDCGYPAGRTNLMKIIIKVISLIGFYLGAEGQYEQVCYGKGM